MELFEVFNELMQRVGADELTNTYWEEIQKAYSNKSRHYHNLEHIKAVYLELLPIRNQIQDWDILLFSVFYHDIIYKSSKTNNELKSAELASQRLNRIGIDETRIKKCRKQIEETKLHQTSDSYTFYLLDADLSILGVEPDQYSLYIKQIRKEYSIYPDLLYKPGRKKVLKHFIEMDRIFKTDHFFQLYENKARANLNDEFDSL